MEITTEKPERLVNLYEDNARVWKLLRKDKEPLKSLQVIEDTLLGFGLSNNEIRVYIHLARSGVRKAREISDALSLHRTETYRILRDLEKRGLVSSILEKPLKFMATPFEETIDILIKTKKQKIKLLERQKKNLVNIWFSIPQQKIKPQSKEVFQILEGEEQINLKADELLENSKKEIYLLAPDLDLLRLYHSGFTDKLEKFSRKSLEIRLLTNYSPKSRFIVDKMKLIYVKYLSSNVEELPSFIISDQGQILFSIKNDNDVQDIGMRRKKGRISSLWTNYEAFVKALKMLFFELWNTETSSSLART
ncbi:MAG: helix-turn-helix domain-containing protein [Candidatus Bathyarchaeota archaeon]